MMNTRKILFQVFLIGLFFSALSCDEDESLSDVGTAEVFFSDETYRIVESSEDAIRIPVNLSNGYHSGGSVMVSVEGGVIGEDYTLDQEESTFELAFGEAETTKFFSITPIDDIFLQQDVEIEIRLSNPSNNFRLGQNQFLQVILLDDEERLTAEVSFDTLAYEVAENEELLIDLGFNNLSTDGGMITLVTGGGDAIYGEDYIIEGANEDGEITLNVDEYGDAASFTVKPVDNDEFEENKNFQVQILETTGGIEIGDDSIATVTIVEDDASPFTTIGFDQSSTALADEGTSEVTIDFSLSQALANAETISVNVGSASSATLGEDFTFADNSTTQPYELNLEAGATSGSLTLLITDDEEEEGDETILLNIANLSGDLELDNANSSFTFTIQDNDGEDTGGGTGDVAYLETFESYNGEEADFAVENLGFDRIILSGQTMPDSEVPTVINNSNNFSDVDDVNGTSDNGLNIFTNSETNPELPENGVVDNVLITPAVENVNGDVTFNIDMNYAFKNQNSGEVTFYYSNTYDGSGDWNESDWTVLGTESATSLDAEGYGNNVYKREEFTANSTGTLYFAIRVTNEMSADNYRFRFRFDNIKVINN